MKILVTGAAGFIGYHTIRNLLRLNYEVVGVDNLNNYYNPAIKENRLEKLFSLNEKDKFRFFKTDINSKKMDELFSSYRITHVIHLAAQAGVRHSVEHPHDYILNNVTGFQNVIDLCKKYETPLIYASSSSVYQKKFNHEPYKENDPTRPGHLYGITKLSNELTARAYWDLFGLRSIGLRFFSVYGTEGRPDSFFMTFLRNKREGKKITIYNNGDMFRDFTHVSSIVTGILFSLIKLESDIGAKIYNLGNGNTVRLKDLIKYLDPENQAKIEFTSEMASGDVQYSCADIGKAMEELGYNPWKDIKTGLTELRDWYDRRDPMEQIG